MVRECAWMYPIPELLADPQAKDAYARMASASFKGAIVALLPRAESHYKILRQLVRFGNLPLTRRPHERVRLDLLALLQLSAHAAKATLARRAGITASTAILRIARKTGAAHASTHARVITRCTGAEPSPTCFGKRAVIATSPAVVCIVNKCDRIDASSLAPFLRNRAGCGANSGVARWGLGGVLPSAASHYYKGRK
jgi:hypothetical protein